MSLNYKNTTHILHPGMYSLKRKHKYSAEPKNNNTMRNEIFEGTDLM
jgi:hypothetical protein